MRGIFSPTARFLPAGVGFRVPHYADIIATRPAVGFLEVHAENYLGGGAPSRQLETLRENWPISIHGVGLSLGSVEGVDRDHLARVASLVERIEPSLVSEHLAWSSTDGVYLNDLLPVPYTEDALDSVVRNVSIVQERLRRRILVENPSRYLRFVDSAVPEEEFLAALVSRTGCGLLCDVNNIYVSCTNTGGDTRRWIDALPAAAVGEIHLAGHTANIAGDAIILIDDHGSRVAPPVWELYEMAVRCFPHAPALVEWDSDLPDLSVLIGEATSADRRRMEALSEVNHAYAA
jgi:hypothetical protein